MLTVTRTSIEASETAVTVYVNGNSKTVTLSGENAGTFSIQTPADGTHATAEINPDNNNELIITPKAIGGTSVIIVEENGKKTVTINIEVKGTTIEANPQSVIAYVGGIAQQVTLGGENTEGFIVETEPDKGVATASISGNTLTITPVGKGNASVVVKETNGNKTTTVNVEVRETTITADPTSVTLYAGGSNQIVTLGGEEAGTFIVESNLNGAVATAEINPENNKELIITPVAAGSTEIVVREQNGNKKITIDVEVYEPKIEVSAEEVVVYVGGDAQTVTLGGDYVGKFSVESNTNEEAARAEINASNNNELIITPVGAGKTTITLTESNGNKTVSIEVEVKTTTMAEVGKVTAYVGGNPQEIPITGTNLGNLSIDPTGTVLDENIAGVSINNETKTVTITPKSKGNTGVTIKEENGNKTITIEIEVKESSIIVDGTVILYLGGVSKTLNITGENIGDISIEATESGIVTTQLQDQTLTITPEAVGNTTLTLKESNGNQTAEIAVEVKLTSITPQTVEVYEGGNAKTVTIEGLNMGTLTIETPTDGTYATAEINPDNNKELIVTPVKAGNTSIELKESNGNATATINISVLTTTITANSTNVTATLGLNETVTLGGENTEGFIVETNPDNNVATATIDGNILTITPVGAGATSVVIKETNGNKTITIDITVLDTLDPPTMTFKSKTTSSITVDSVAQDAAGRDLTYTLYVSTNQDGPYTAKATQTQTAGTSVTLTASDLDMYTTYYYYVGIQSGAVTAETPTKGNVRTYCSGRTYSCTPKYCSGGYTTTTKVPHTTTTTTKTCTTCSGKGTIACNGSVTTDRISGNICPSCGDHNMFMVYQYCSKCSASKPVSKTCSKCGYNYSSTFSHNALKCSTCSGTGKVTTTETTYTNETTRHNCSHGYYYSHYYCSHYNNTSSSTHYYCAHSMSGVQHD